MGGRVAVCAEILNAGEHKGRKLYVKHCIVCHGVVLEGVEVTEPDGRRIHAVPALDDTGRVWRHSDKVLFGLVRFGEHVLVTKSSTWKMPGFRYQLREDETWMLIAYIKSTWSEEFRARQSEATVRAQRLEEKLN